MKTVYVFGAGASHASPNVHVETKTKYPLDKGFWLAVDNLKLLNEKTYLFKFLQIVYGEKNNLNNVGMEEVYTFVDNIISILEMGGLAQFDHLDDKDDLRRPIALSTYYENHHELLTIIDEFNEKSGTEHFQTSLKYMNFFRGIEKELIELIYKAFQSIKPDWNCSLHNKFIDKILSGEAETSIISFNYDLLLDQTLMGRGLTANIDFSYYIWLHQYSQIGGNDNKDIFAIFRKAYIPNDKIELLKLHGSLNWFVLLNHANLQPEADMYAIAGKENIQVNSYYNLHLSGGEAYNKSNVLLQRAIIAPVLEKLKKFKSTFSFESLWTRSLERLKEAEKIVFIGYSMPQADYLARWLFRMGYTLNPKKDLTVQVVNPCLEVEDEFKKIYSKAKFEPRVNGFQEYVDSM